MRAVERGRICGAALLSLAAVGCAFPLEGKPLPMPASLPTPRRDCTLGVARIADDDGVDLSYDVRDYLHEHGPCKTVIDARERDDPRADYVVGGSGSGHWFEDQSALLIAGGTGMGVGIATLIGAGTIALIGASPQKDGNGNNIPGTQTDPGLVSAAGPIAIGGLALLAVGVSLMVLDGAAFVHSRGTVKGDFTVSQRGADLADIHLANSDSVTTGKGGGALSAHARQYRLLLDPVYANLTVRLDEIVTAHPPKHAVPAPDSPAAPSPTPASSTP